MKKLSMIILSTLLVISFAFTSLGFSAIAVKSIKLNSSKISLTVGQTYVLKATITPANTTQKILKYSISNKNIATVDTKGIIKAIKAGTASITVTSSANSKVTAKCSITVVDGSRKMVSFHLAKSGDPIETKIAQSVYKKIEEKLKTRVIFDYIPAASYTEKIQILMATGDLPDVVRYTDVNDINLKAHANNGNVIDIGNYIRKSPNLMKYTLEDSFKSMSYKGGSSIFMVPVTTLVRGDGFSIRQDWLDKVGIKVEEGKPITLDQFKDILKKFTLNDPDGNGINDTYGFNVSAENDGQIIPLYAVGTVMVPIEGGFGLTGWQKAVGEPYEYMNPKFSQKSNKFKKYLEFWAEMYKNKYVDPNWGTKKATQAADEMSKGKVGFQAQFPGHVKAIQDRMQMVNPNAKLTWLSGMINPEVGKVTGPSYSSGAYGGYAITKRCKNIERVVEWFDYQLSDEMYPNYSVYGGEGVGYTMVNGKRTATDTYKDPTPGIGGMGSFPIMRRANDPYPFLNLALDEVTTTKVKSWLTIAADNKAISKDMGYVPKAAIQPKFLDYNTKMIEVVTKIVFGLLPSSAYDAALADWYKNGGEDYVKEMNAYIKSIN